MDSDEKKGAQAPPGEGSSAVESSEHSTTSYTPTVDDAYGYHDDPYGYQSPTPAGQAAPPVSTAEPAALVPAATRGGSGTTPPPPPPPDDEGPDEDGMLRMSFFEHLEELRRRIIYCLGGLAAAFLGTLVFANQLWLIVSEPAIEALRHLGADPNLAQITPMDGFSTVYVKLPLLASIFIASPWILYQVWAFIAPGLYKRERRWAAPFVICTAGLFITGGVFAYFVAFRFGLEFLLGIGKGINIKPVVSITDYFDLFVNVTLGIGLVFELPVLIFFLCLLRVVTPKFLLANSRYAILAIVMLAAVVTPTPDVFNLMLFTIPMCMLFFVGIFAGYLLVLHREKRRLPWKKIVVTILVILLLIAGLVYAGLTWYHYKLIPHWPYITR